jgi:hypothetical protein
MKITNRLSLLVFGLLCLSAGCGKKSQRAGGGAANPDGFVFSGQINLSDDVAMQALPLIDGEPTSDSVVLAQSAQVDARGVFSLALPAEFSEEEINDLQLTSEDDLPGPLAANNWVFVLLKKDMNLATATPSERLNGVHSFVGIPDGRDSLINIPTGNMSKGAQPVGLGDITDGEGGFAASSTQLEDVAASFNRDVWELQELASTNDPLRNVKNLIANYDSETQKYFTAEPFFIWNGNQSSAVGAYSNASLFSVGGFGIYFKSNDSRLSIDALCAPTSDSKHIAVTIIPPGNVTGKVGASDVIFNKNNPMTNADVTGATPSSDRHECFSGTFYASGKSNSGETASFNVGGGGFSTAMPEGVWTLTLDDEEAAAFDLAAANPNDKDGNPLVYVPSMQITKNLSDVITSIAFKWYRYNRSTEALEEVTDLTVLNDTIQDLSIELIDYSGIDSNSARIEERAKVTAPSSGSTFTVSGWETPFKVASSSDTNHAVAESITIQYKIYGINVRFDFR